jgi:cyclophilin family peptidyl-prolyl cis-trans isomerase
MFKLIKILFLLHVIIFFINCGTEDYRNIKKTDENPDIENTDTFQNQNIIDKQDPFLENDTAIVTHTALLRTSMGNIVIGLFGEDAPETVANFIGLSKMNYYNGVLFHRVAKNFLIQSGDRNTIFQNRKPVWGLGGQSFYGGDIEDELNPSTPSFRRGYVKGTIAMANKGPNTNTSQFFICLEEANKLEHKWTIFGKVLDGMDVVEKISELPVEKSLRGKNDGIPLKPVRIYEVNIRFIKSPEI